MNFKKDSRLTAEKGNREIGRMGSASDPREASAGVIDALTLKSGRSDPPSKTEEQAPSLSVDGSELALKNHTVEERSPRPSSTVGKIIAATFSASGFGVGFIGDLSHFYFPSWG